MSDKTVIPCEQCRRLLKVPTNRGSIRVQCPDCQAIFMLKQNYACSPETSPASAGGGLTTKKKCLNCGYERQERDDQYGIIPSTDCPRCGAIYEKVEEILKENERELAHKKIRLEEEQKKREWELEHERTRREVGKQECTATNRRDMARDAAEIAAQFKPKTKTGFLMKIAVKTAVKKSLLDITNRMDRFPHLSNKEKVEMFVTIAGMSNELPSCVHWEGTFFFLVYGQTRCQLTSISNFNDYMQIIINLTSDWITNVLGGQAANMYSEINRISSV